MIATGAVLEWLEIAARDFLSYINDKVSALTTPGWVLLAIAALAVLWAWSILHASTRLGAIEVVTLGQDGSTVAPLQALTAALRERLWRVGLAPPPAVPEGAPQANLIKAVEETAPQGATIAKLMELIPTPPKPPQFKLTSTLVGSESQCGMSYTLQPLSAGATYVHTIQDCGSYDDAVDEAAVDIYQYLAKALPEVFPVWVRWRTPEALNSYLAGCDLRTGGDLDRAGVLLESAVDASPFNALAALQLANLDERRAAADDALWPTAYFQARALARYRRTGILWPSIVEARYRASVVSSGLATSYARLPSPAAREAIRAIVPLPGADPQGTTDAVPSEMSLDDEEPVAVPAEVSAQDEESVNVPAEMSPKDEEYVSRLRRFAARESGATVQLLSPAYTLVRQQRLRNQFESKGRDRRALHDTVRISRDCVHMRGLNEGDDDMRHRVEAWYRTAKVLLLTWTDLSWQARYNAACFDALRLAGPFMTAGRRRGVERRALRNLDRAIREAAGELTRGWVKNDPDMEYFRAPGD